MTEILFIPFSTVGGLLAGILGKRLFDGVWGVIDDEQAPDPKHREVGWGKLALALVLQGAISRAMRGLFDHASRVAYSRVVGRWPGKERPETA